MRPYWTIAVIAAYTLTASPFAFSQHNSGGVDASTALKELMEGNHRFASGIMSHPNQSPVRREELAKGQKPFAVVLTCADSRLSPEVIFDQGLGDVFVVRVAGNTFGKDILGSIEYAVEHLGSRLIVVMGHEKCGAVDAALKGGHLPGSLPAIIDPLKPALEATKNVKENRLDATILANIRIQVKKMKAQSPILAKLIREKQLKIVGAYYDLDTGIVTPTEGGVSMAH